MMKKRTSCCGNKEDRTDIKSSVRANYAKIAKGSSSCCGTTNVSCCTSKKIGYKDEDLLQSIMQDLKTSRKESEELINSMVSINVYAEKR